MRIVQLFSILAVLLACPVIAFADTPTEIIHTVVIAKEYPKNSPRDAQGRGALNYVGPAVKMVVGHGTQGFSVLGCARWPFMCPNPPKPTPPDIVIWERGN